MPHGEGGDTGLLDFAQSIIGTGTPDVGGEGFTLPDPGVGNMDTGTNWTSPGLGGEGGGSSGVVKFAGDLLGGLGREVTGSPLKAFSSGLGLAGMGMGLLNQ